MRTIIKGVVKSVYSEHAYVRQPIIKIEDDDNAIHAQIRKLLLLAEIDIYSNHFVLECEQEGYKFMLGYDDNTVFIGFGIVKQNDSVEIPISDIWGDLKLQIITK